MSRPNPADEIELFIHCKACIQRFSRAGAAAQMVAPRKLSIGVSKNRSDLVVICPEHGLVGRFRLAESVGGSCGCCAEEKQT